MEEHDLEIVYTNLRLQGYELTQQRLKVIEALSMLQEVEEAEELWLYINKKFKISLAGVYSILNMLIRAGHVVKMKIASNRKLGYRFRYVDP